MLLRTTTQQLLLRERLLLRFIGCSASTCDSYKNFDLPPNFTKEELKAVYLRKAKEVRLKFTGRPKSHIVIPIDNSHLTLLIGHTFSK